MLKALPATVLLAIGLTLAPQSATADVEPNGSLPEAEGPLSGGSYSGMIVHGVPKGERPPEADWYLIHSTGQNELAIEITAGDELDFILRDATGTELARVWVPTIDEFFSGPVHLRFTTPIAPQILYLEISHESEGTTGLVVPYKFNIGPPGALGPGVNPFTPLIWADSEPNNNRAQAFGPLQASVSYTGRQDVEGDRDLFHFYALGAESVQITVTTRDEICYGPDAALLDATGRELTGSGNEYSLLARFTYTTPSGWPRKYYVRMKCDSYVFRLDSPSAVVPPCDFAKLTAKKYKMRIARLKRVRKRLAWGPGERRTIRALKHSKRELRKARRSAKALC